ncbi:hypothetical protein C5F50_05795 [Nitrosopumilus ureiphilus]|uniref:Uncharacterized protein n=1 Tax=Nitrosopumilus ureiphilus TaxID=1470067 RepID=A0A7D5R6M9_9ARCH|nr:hypothetical protein C5F50_05795 [Nitrosopumilus ureiphilus]
MTRFFPNWCLILNVLYHFELQMAGVILFTAMAIGGISLWLKRRSNKDLQELTDSDTPQNI